MSIRFAPLCLMVAAFNLSGWCSAVAAAPVIPVHVAASLAAESEFDISTPVGVMQESFAAFNENDVDRLLRASLSESMYQSLRTEMESIEPPSAAASQAFASQLEQWTAPDAVDQAMVQLEPMIAGLKPQVQAAIASLQATVASLPAEQQEQAQALADGLAGWAESNAFDADQVRAALTALRQTVIDLELESLEAFSALSYEEKAAKAGLLLAGIKLALVEFDLDLYAITDSLTAEAGTVSGNNATVLTGVTLFGARIEGELPLLKVEGRWLTPIGTIGLVVYNDYLSRAQVAEAVMDSGAAKTAITEYYASTGEMPEAGQFDYPSPSRYATVTHDAEGVITVSLHEDRPVNTQIRGYRLTLSPQIEDAVITQWNCSSENANPKYLPGSCR